ncbi:hypothetical protein BKA69DRAFT_1079739 [Paraphysoderma sedebokerense]|nr:hypothetical protein BKA69DRAFT_1079739 [Paraphysoderma sedebokerense]
MKFEYHSIYHKSRNSKIKLTPSRSHCDNCQSELSQPFRQRTFAYSSSPVLFDIAYPFTDVEVYLKRCYCCNTIIHYDGRHESVVNVDDTVFCTERLLRDALRDHYTKGSTFFAFWKCLLARYEDYGIPRRLNEKWQHLRNRFQRAVLGYVDLCSDIAIRPCPCGGRNGIVLDALNMSIKRKHLETLRKPWAADGTADVSLSHF